MSNLKNDYYLDKIHSKGHAEPKAVPAEDPLSKLSVEELRELIQGKLSTCMPVCLFVCGTCARPFCLYLITIRSSHIRNSK